MAHDAVMLEIQRALGRVEESQKNQRQEMANGLQSIRDEFAGHKQDDQRNFSSLRAAIRDEGDKREDHLDSQDNKLGALEVMSKHLQDQDQNARTIGKYILGLIGTLMFMIGSAVIAAITGHVKWQ